METTARQETQQMLASSETRPGEPKTHIVEVPMAMYDMITTGNAAALPITTAETLFVDDRIDFVSISGTAQMRIVMVMSDDPEYEKETRVQRWLRMCLNRLGYADPIAVQFAYFKPINHTPKVQFEFDDWDKIQVVLKWVEENADDDSDVWHWATDFLDPQDADSDGDADAAKGFMAGTTDAVVGDSGVESEVKYVCTTYDKCWYILANNAYSVGELGDIIDDIGDKTYITLPGNGECAHLHDIGRWQWCDSNGVVHDNT